MLLRVLGRALRVSLARLPEKQHKKHKASMNILLQERWKQSNLRWQSPRRSPVQQWRRAGAGPSTPGTRQRSARAMGSWPPMSLATSPGSLMPTKVPAPCKISLQLLTSRTFLACYQQRASLVRSFCIPPTMTVIEQDIPSAMMLSLRPVAGGLRAWAAKRISSALSNIQAPQLALEHVVIRKGDLWATLTGEAIPRHVQNVDLKLKLGRDYRTLTLDITGLLLPHVVSRSDTFSRCTLLQLCAAAASSAAAWVASSRSW